MRNSPFVNSSNESNYVFLVSDYIGPLQKLNWNTHLFSGDNTQLYVYPSKNKKKTIHQLTQSALAFVDWAALRHAQVHKMGSFLRQKMSTINHSPSKLEGVAWSFKNSLIIHKHTGLSNSR